MTKLSSPQIKALTRGVTRVSGGQVELPRLAYRDADARAIWKQVCAAFPKAGWSGEALLDDQQHARFARALWRKSRGRIHSPDCPATKAQALALWHLACTLAALEEQADRAGARRRQASIVAIAFGASQMAACSLIFGRHVRGNFTCAAPGGICAPTTVIDDKALAMIAGTAERAPVGPFEKPAEMIGEGRGHLTSVTRTAPRVLRIVFPAHVDDQGRLHDTAVIRAVVDQGRWRAVEVSDAQGDASGAASSQSGGLAFIDGDESRSAAAPADMSSLLEQAPSAQAVAAARAKAKSSGQGAAALSQSPDEGRTALQQEVNALLAKPLASGSQASQLGAGALGASVGGKAAQNGDVGSTKPPASGAAASAAAGAGDAEAPPPKPIAFNLVPHTPAPAASASFAEDEASTFRQVQGPALVSPVNRPTRFLGWSQD